jgi:hypothetical protein
MRSRRWAAGKELESRGVQFVTDVEGNESEAWTYFRGVRQDFWGLRAPNCKGYPEDLIMNITRPRTSEREPPCISAAH